MSEIVFILGAGASKHTGAPLMAEFLDVADGLRRQGQTGAYQNDFDRVFDAISKLQAVHSKSELSLDDLESVFGAFEMARLLSTFPGLPSGEIENLLNSFRRVIAKTLEETVRFSLSGGSKYHIDPHRHYQEFARLVGELDHEHQRRRCTTITFNYDIGLDYAFHHSGYEPEYCLAEEEAPSLRPILLKLHGSLNWARCEVCDAIVPWQLSSYFSGRRVEPLAGANFINLRLASQFDAGQFCHCSKRVTDAPVIVPPTWNKTEYHSTLARIWQRAARELSDAERIFVSGYSLTETDSFFRYLFAIGAVGDARIKCFSVVDPAEGSDVENRFKKLLGTAARARFEYQRAPFPSLTEVVREQLRH